MTIKEMIIKNELAGHKIRLARLKELGAPDIMISSEETFIEGLEMDYIVIKGNQELLDVGYENHELRKGNGGISYIAFNNRTINYFPSAKFGRCIYRDTKNHKEDTTDDTIEIDFDIE